MVLLKNQKTHKKEDADNKYISLSINCIQQVAYTFLKRNNELKTVLRNVHNIY